MARSGLPSAPDHDQRSDRSTNADASDQPSSGPPAVPTVSLPKGGGAIRGIGEKFAANPVSGTGAMSVPIAVSAGRSGFGPELSLSYDSGSGNGPFGFGWSLSLPSITRKTDQGLPQYRDGDEPDVFILSGSEDLVPERDADGAVIADTSLAPEYTVFRYRPRVEGSFARIERWQRDADNDIHWRSISRDNLLTIYGKDAAARIADPADPRRVFSWLICETRDDRGNAVVYDYRAENSDDVDTVAAHEANRSAIGRTANRYVKRIRYGNRTPLLGVDGRRPLFLSPTAIADAGWMFEAVFDYGEHDAAAPLPLDDERDGRAWRCRRDPFSSYRSGFDMRTYRRCERVLMFHHFPDEPGVGPDCLVRSTDFTYREVGDGIGDPSRVAPIASFITAVTQRGYTRRAEGGYTTRSLPPLDFEYSEVVIHREVKEIDADSVANLPAGLDEATYHWIDLDGDGVAGVLTEQAHGWFYKRNLGDGRLGPIQPVARLPSLAALGGGRQQLLDLAGDGRLDLVDFGGSTPGFFERGDLQEWESFRPFASLPNISWDAPNVRFVDLNGDGMADVLITEHDVLTWYPSLAEEGFGDARAVHQPGSEEDGPRLIFAEGSESIYTADMSGDGLSDLVRIRNGEVCYWPSLGYGRFGPKVSMDNAPVFDHPDQFDRKRVRLADIDGSGTSDIIYLGRDGLVLYFNECGNRWSAPRPLTDVPPIDNVASVAAVDILGNGTACLVWSSPRPGDAPRHVRYVDLMGGQKPHLLVRTVNNLGAETRVQYASSTKFFLADRAAGRPWITRLPFPVQVVERVDTYDRVGRNRFVSLYAYHHGYFDGVEREFRGFGMVEQRDTEELAILAQPGNGSAGGNVDVPSHVPPVCTKTWFHTGIHTGRGRVSDYFAGLFDGTDRGEYYREPAWRDDDGQAREHLLADTELPAGLTLDEEREACRALKGAMLRQEVYALDGSDKAEHPYRVTEQSFAVRRLQRPTGRAPGVFFTHARETITYHYERNPFDPRIAHSLTIEVDDFGNVSKSALVGYGRRQPDSSLPLDDDRRQQAETRITYTETAFTNAVAADGACRTPVEAEARTFELTGFTPTGAAGRFRIDDFLASSTEISYEAAPTGGRERRLIEHVRTLFRPDDLGESEADTNALLPVGTLESLALPGDVHKLAFTPGLLAAVFRRTRGNQPPETLVPDPAALEGAGYVSDADGRWWMPSGRVFLSPGAGDDSAQELAFAREHFFIARRYRDPFHTDARGTETLVTYDRYDLLARDVRDPLGNRITAGERQPDGQIDPNRPGHDYRVLQARVVTDANRNRSEVAFDALGLVVGTAVKGKDDTVGDALDAFDADLPQSAVDAFADAPNPLDRAPGLLQRATTRIVYDVNRFHRTRLAHPDDDTRWLPAFAATLSRETHVTEPLPSGGLRIQIGFSYSDGFGREIQRKIQAEPGPLADGGPIEPLRWVGSGWTVFNNKGRPVRQFEPFFSRLTSSRHQFEFGAEAGVSPILFYDPLERLIAKLNPDRTYEKVVFDAWTRATYDANDTVAPAGAETGDPRTDPDVGGALAAYLATLPAFETWHQERIGGARGAAEQDAARKAAAHANTPTIVHFDALGRPFLTLAHNGFAADGTPILFPTRVTIDIEGNQRDVRDPIVIGDDRGRIVMHYDYDLLGNRVHQSSLDAGERWVLSDVLGKPVRTWNSRGQDARTEYDALRRPVRTFVLGADPARPADELIVDRLIYGEQHPEGELRNLRGHVYLRLDQGGAVSTDRFDFKGNPLLTSRRLGEYRQAVDWSAVDAAVPVDGSTPFDGPTLEAALAPLVDAHRFTGRSTYDALNRQIQWVPPRSAEAGASRHVVQPVYNEASLVERIDVWLDRPADPGALLDRTTVPPSPAGVGNIDYNARGQRVRIELKNGATTEYVYDATTFRLTHQHTDAGATTDLQDLRYTYDPAGNIVHVEDDAQQTLFFRNRQVEPSADYAYDPTYRLLEASGREHLGQVGGPPVAHSYNDMPRVGIAWAANDGDAMGRYVEHYRYDAAGNLLGLRHVGSDPAHPGWTRTFEYDGPGNRLSRSTVGTGTPETYSYDPHGNVLGMPQLQAMAWTFTEQLQMTRRQAVSGADGDGAAHDGERTYYVYDAAGTRVRKVTESGTGQMFEERIYVGGVEVFRRTGAASLVRETLHLSATERLALVESRVQGDEPGIPAQLTRYQLGNHLGSASLELNDAAAIVSYEEYTPFGSTSYQAVESATQTPKRYRYAGRERDEESGLYYQGARYYAPWLARWTSADPQGIEDGPNVFAYVRNNPVARVDASGMDTLTTVTTDNFRELLRASISKAGNFTPTDTRLDELAGQYMKSYEASKTAYYVSKDPILDEFKLQMDLFGRKTTKLKDFKPPGWEQAGGNEAACFQLACAGVTQTVKAGETATGGGGVILYEAVKRRIKTDKTASDLALSQIKRHIDSGRAIVGGVNEPGHGGQVDAVKQPVTDHYVAIYGYEADLQGNITALFARDNAVAGTTEVRFTVNATTGEITKPVEKRPKGEEYLNQEYQLSEVRFNTALPYTGDLKPENDAKQIMYWPVKKDDDKDKK